jgi:hypothetical protein
LTLNNKHSLIKFLFIVGKPPSDDVLLADMKLKPNTKIMMMGTREEELVGIHSFNLL